MKALWSTVSIILFLAVRVSPAAAAPVVLGLQNKHPLTEPQAGELLVSELRCMACHTRKSSPPSLDRAAPLLADIGSRAAPDFLQRFIASPSTAHAGTTMPDLLLSESAEQRNKIAEAITHFLVALTPKPFNREPIGEKEASQGKVLFHTVGCIACHSPRDEEGKEMTREGVVELGHIPAKYSLASLAEFLFQPTRVRPSGRMPDMKLTPDEAKAIASYLLNKSKTSSAWLKPREELVVLGKKYFQELNCAACHKVGDIPAAESVGDLQHSNPVSGCLSKKPARSPRFNLSDDQTKAIRAAITKRSEPPTDKMLLDTTLTAFNCIACHIRDNFGGVSAERNMLFQTSAKNLGDDGRIPPPLTLLGAKLQPVWLKKVLFDAESVRPYMLTRMPQYGEPNLRHLPDLFSRLDKIEGFEFSLPNSESDNEKERTRARQLRDAGRELLGDKSLYCVACHNFNGKTPNNNGIELMTSYQRLKPSWFYRFLRDPGAYRPRIVMPVSWPDGIAAQKTVLGGDTDRQIEAIWYFLSLGTSAPDPSGVHATETKLLVTDSTQTYRGRSSVAGYRGIAVGFPEKLSYAFNAETGTLSAVWRGDFVRVDRSGQGSGAFNPASKFIALAQDVSFFALADEKTPWPLRPIMTKEQPVNPDPLYPKNRGYQFKGYEMDDDSIPTFLYRSGDIDIEDRSTVRKVSDNIHLIRNLTFKSPRDQTIWFRALTGKVETESKDQFKIPELRLKIPPLHKVLRPIASDKSASELLLKIDIPKGKSELSFIYEILK